MQLIVCYNVQSRLNWACPEIYTWPARQLYTLPQPTVAPKNIAQVTYIVLNHAVNYYSDHIVSCRGWMKACWQTCTKSLQYRTDWKWRPRERLQRVLTRMAPIRLSLEIDCLVGICSNLNGLWTQCNA